MSVDEVGIKIGGRYELIQDVASGGMATVWRAAVHGAAGFTRVVALKRIREDLRGLPHIIDMFVEEARVGAALRHPNVVQVHDFGVDENGDHYLVTEWVQGIHLGDYAQSYEVRGEKAPFEIVTAMAIGVLRALSAAHTRMEVGKPAPILHRDVTPQNILLDENGVVKLADFGLARAMDRDRMTSPDIVKGKLSYMAPELTRGGLPTARSDLFSLGVVMWETIAGQRLFDGLSDAEVYQMLQAPKVPMLSMKRPDIPLSLAMQIHRALETDPAKRFQSAQEMLTELLKDQRRLPEPVDAPDISQSVREAIRRLRASKTPEAARLANEAAKNAVPKALAVPAFSNSPASRPDVSRQAAPSAKSKTPGAARVSSKGGARGSAPPPPLPGSGSSERSQSVPPRPNKK